MAYRFLVRTHRRPARRRPAPQLPQQDRGRTARSSRAWLEDARRRAPVAGRRTAHLAGKTNLREPFERLVDTGLRLNELRSSDELHEFLIDEATELSGAERVLLVLETPDGPRLAGSLVPRGEDARSAAAATITPCAAEVAAHARGEPRATAPKAPTTSTSARASSRR